ncbi:hypothetical protein CRUP_020197, partial [Coryphaenoides rupestris]
MAFLARFISLCNYLQDPCLVAKFQKLCGVKATFPATSESELSRDDANAKDVDATGNQSRDSCRNGSAAAVLLRSREAEADADLARAKPLRKNSLTGDVGKEFIGRNRVLFYLFTFGTELGNEMFFIVRRLIIVWAWNLFIGQSTKDLVRWSRPASPPVVKVEVFLQLRVQHAVHHAMTGTAIPFSLFPAVVWTYSFSFGPLRGSRMESPSLCQQSLHGMHSVLEVITGFLYSLLILAVLQPMLDAIDGFYAAHPWAPPAILLSHVGMGLLAFSLDSWSTSRGDTARRWAPADPPFSVLPLVVPAAGVSVVARSLARFVLGVVVLLVARMAMKAVTIPALCRVFGMPAGDVRSARQHMRVELPYRYIVYSVVGFCC